MKYYKCTVYLKAPSVHTENDIGDFVVKALKKEFIMVYSLVLHNPKEHVLIDFAIRDFVETSRIKFERAKASEVK